MSDRRQYKKRQHKDAENQSQQISEKTDAPDLIDQSDFDLMDHGVYKQGMVLNLQRTIGNKAVQRLFSKKHKRTFDESGDEYYTGKAGAHYMKKDAKKEAKEKKKKEKAERKANNPVVKQMESIKTYRAAIKEKRGKVKELRNALAAKDQDTSTVTSLLDSLATMAAKQNHPLEQKLSAYLSQAIFHPILHSKAKKLQHDVDKLRKELRSVVTQYWSVYPWARLFRNHLQIESPDDITPMKVNYVLKTKKDKQREEIAKNVKDVEKGRVKLQHRMRPFAEDDVDEDDEISLDESEEYYADLYSSSKDEDADDEDGQSVGPAENSFPGWDRYEED